MRQRQFFLVVMAIWALSFGASPGAGAAFDPYCGDGICQDNGCGEWQTFGDGCLEDHGSYFCEADCGNCGDGICDLDHESQSSCEDDCGSCGDGVCSVYIEANRDLEWNWCETDCGDIDDPDYQYCNQNSDCPGQVCTYQHVCADPSPDVFDGSSNKICGGSCTTNGSCCGSDVCYGGDGTMAPGARTCGPPRQSWCSESPACNDNEDCYAALLCWPNFGYNTCSQQMYCDPGLGRCQYAQGTACPVL